MDKYATNETAVENRINEWKYVFTASNDGHSAIVLYVVRIA